MHWQQLLLLALPLLSSAQTDTQVPMKDMHGDGVYTPQTHASPRLVELLTIEPRASIFYTYARETRMSELFAEEGTGGQGVAVLVPTNKAVMALTRKPHQGVDVEVGISDEELDKQSRANVERWVAAHIIPHSPIDLSSNSTHETLLPGKFVTFVVGRRGEVEERALVNGDVAIVDVKEASNGWMYLIDGTITPDE